MMDDDDDKRSAWHLIKGVSLPTLFMLLMQTGALIWYAAQFTFEQKQQAVRLSTVETTLAKIAENSTASIAPAAVNAAKLSVLESQVNSLLVRQESVRDELARIRATK